MSTPASAGMKTLAPFHIAGRHWLAPYSASQSESAWNFGASSTLCRLAFAYSFSQVSAVTAWLSLHSARLAKASVWKPSCWPAETAGSFACSPEPRGQKVATASRPMARERNVFRALH